MSNMILNKYPIKYPISSIVDYKSFLYTISFIIHKFYYMIEL